MGVKLGVDSERRVLVKACRLWCAVLCVTCGQVNNVRWFELSFKFLGVYGSIQFKSLHHCVSPYLWLINSGGL